MKLCIDTSNSNKTVVMIGQKVYEEQRQPKSQALLPLIVKALNTENISVNEITEIEYNTGPGSFTGLRVGASVANTIGWAKNISVNGAAVLSNEVPKINYSSKSGFSVLDN